MKYINYLKARGISKLTIQAYLCDLKKFDLTHITKEKIDEWIVNTELSPKSVCRVLSALKSWFKFQGINIELLHPKTPKKFPTIATDNEMTRIMKQAKTLMEKTIVNLLYDTGARVNELKMITKDQIELATNSILLHRKGNKEGIVFFTDTTKKFLKKQMEKVENEVFPISVRTIERIIGRLTKRAGIRKNITPHTLRHSIATHLYETNGDIRFVQELLGHASLQTTQIYTHLSRKRMGGLYEKYR